MKTKTHQLLLFFSLFILLSVPNSLSAQISNVLDNIEDQLNRAVIERDFDTLWELRNHSNRGISYRASMALIHADPVHHDWLFQQVIGSKSVRDWIVLSHTDINKDHLRDLQQLALEEGISKEHACEVFYRQGDERSLQFLLYDDGTKSVGERCAMAIGGLLARVKVSDSDIHRLLDIYENSSSQDVRRNLLYGFSRSELNRPRSATNLHKRVADLFHDHTSSNPISLIDQYFVTALGSAGVSIGIEGRSAEDLRNHIQFSIELARITAEADNKDRLISFSRALIEHPNKHVKIQLMESLEESEHFSVDLLRIMMNHVNLNTENPEILLSYLDLLVHLNQDISGQIRSLYTISNQNPYLINQVYSLLEVILDQSDFIDMLLDDLNEEGIRSKRASEALGTLLDTDSLDEGSQADIKRTLLDQIMKKNRSVLDPSVQVFSKIGLDDEEIQSLTELYKTENEFSEIGFKKELYLLLSEVAAERHYVLSEPILKPFRKPDINQLVGLGYNPVWVLQTNKGEVRILLYPEEAPFTVSSVMNLTKSGFYDNVAFHRVVRNFVIQGGDFDRRDGFGGPPYRIPTEPSIETFSRGKVGIASSGPDTEGSQIFITHTWTPHLDGLYTIFGEVIQGMDVVDRIQIGDTVTSAIVE